MELCEPFTLLEQPLVVVALEQLAPVRLDRVLEPTLLDGLLESRDVQPHGCIRAQLQRARAGVDEPIRVGQRAAEVVQYVAQVRPRLRLGGVRP